MATTTKLNNPEKKKKGLKPASAKQKGRKFQQQVRDALLDAFSEILRPEDIRSISMGSAGDDLLLSPLAKAILPIGFEMKKVESPSLWEALRQANDRSTDTSIPIVVFSRNKVKLPQAIVCMPTFFFRHIFAPWPFSYNWSRGIIPEVTSVCFDRARELLESEDAWILDKSIDPTGHQWHVITHKPQHFNLWSQWNEYLNQPTGHPQPVCLAVNVCRPASGITESQTLCSFGNFLRLIYHHWKVSEARQKLCPSESEQCHSA